MLFGQLAASFAGKIDFGPKPTGALFVIFPGIRVMLRPDLGAEHFLNICSIRSNTAVGAELYFRASAKSMFI